MYTPEPYSPRCPRCEGPELKGSPVCLTCANAHGIEILKGAMLIRIAESLERLVKHFGHAERKS